MTARRTAPGPVLPDGRLDWSHAHLGEPLPCKLCGRPARLRHPISGWACHKTCSDAAAKNTTTDTSRRAA